MHYYNYHRHDMFGNIVSLDVIVKPEDYCKRAIELGHKAIFTTNHGMQGNLFDSYSLAHQYNLKLIVGAEVYYVNDSSEKDRTNYHMVIICKNNNAVKQLNKILTRANVEGYYYKPRVDHSDIFSLSPNDFIITTACVAGVWQEEKMVKELKDYFGTNFFLEVQNHDEIVQKEANKVLLNYAYKYNIEIIHGNDSHYIFPEDAKYRELFLKAKGIIYENESNFILDYPDVETIINRYKKQGVLSEPQYMKAIENTNIFDCCEEITIINEEIKLPCISKDSTKELKNIINEAWKKERNNIPESKHSEYLEQIRYEMDIIEKTSMEDYFLIDHKVAELAENKYNGKLTNTGRGSAPSFYITKLLGLTDLDRIAAPITLFPTRFMSVERILGTKSLPDIDLNTADPIPFIKATEDILGKENCAWMISWKPLKKSSAFRLYCKAMDLNFEEYNEIAKNIEQYEKEDEEESLELDENVTVTTDDYWADMIEKSKPFIGVVESISPSPCSMLLYDKSVAEEMGLIKVKDKYCCLLDGYNCDKFKYLKNDYLTTTVWAIIKDTCDLANINIPSIPELDKLLDDKTYEVYEKSLTCSINQADSVWATHLVSRYKPTSPAEMSAFVAIIRPGCASLLNNFIDRKPYTTGIKELDNLLVDGSSRMIYQELIMKYLIWLGIPETGSYDIIKKIAKKKFKEAELAELKQKLVKGWEEKVGKPDGFEETWRVVEDAARYSFNASHSLSYAYDSLYGAYLKSHYPLEYYTVALNYYANDETRTERLIQELSYYKIELRKPQFRYSKSEYFLDKSNNTIYKGISSIKFLNESSADFLYSLKDNIYNDFIDLLKELKDSNTINSRQLSILISLQFFNEFGGNKKLLDLQNLFDEIYNSKVISKDKFEKLNLLKEDLEGCFEKSTEKQYRNVDSLKILKNINNRLPNINLPIDEQIKIEIDSIGKIVSTFNLDKKNCYVSEIDTKYSPKVKLYCLQTGKEITVKIQKNFYKIVPIKKGDLIYCNEFIKKNKSIKTEKGFEKTNEMEFWLNNYRKLEDL